MKLVHKSTDKKEKTKKNNGIKPKKEHVLIVAQEIKFARLLSGNEKKTRDRVLKSLKKWLLNCFERKYEFKEDDFTRVWKGLFYAVWMSDKPLVQEELCDSIAEILDLFPAEQLRFALMMTKAGLKVLATEWYGIDQHRMDKFLMLVRRYIRGSLRCVRRCGWQLEACRQYAHMLASNDGLLALKTPTYARNALSLSLHIADCFLEELSKVAEGDIPSESVSEVLSPFVRYMCLGAQPELVAAARRVLTALLRQSAPGLRYSHATRAWGKMGCPAGGPEALELVSDDEGGEEGGEGSGDEESGGVLDPRAGRVDVVLTPLPTPAADLARCLKELLPHTTSKAYKRTKIFIDRFEQLSREEYPLRVEGPTRPPARPRGAAKGAHALIALEKKLIASADELALRGLGRKHRKRLLAKSRAGLSIVEEIEQTRQAPHTAANDKWQIESMDKEKKAQDSSDKENRQKPKASRDTDTQTDKPNKKRKINAEQLNGDVTAKKQKIDSKNKYIKKESTQVLNESKTEKNKKTDHCNKQIKNADKSPVSKKQMKTVDKSMDKLQSNQVLNERKNKKTDNNKQIKTVDKKTPDSKNQMNTVDKAMDAIDKQIAAIKKQNIDNNKTDKTKTTPEKSKATSVVKKPALVVNKVKKFQKQVNKDVHMSLDTPKKVKFVLKNNSMQKPVDYYKSVRQSPNIPFDSSKVPVKTNLKLSSPSPINPFFKKKLKHRKYM